jgi:hypothetical protein
VADDSVADDSVSGCYRTGAGCHPLVPQPQTGISYFRSTAISRAGLNQICCGTAVGKTRESPCL